ncbi:hypothetical protein [Halobaculum sp. MBLA0143]|uniref:hypothetical protein n=1 Tax=Halobaculum sp. MBLA0143 TaxID=3079933 RepID=UPI003523FA33
METDEHGVYIDFPVAVDYCRVYSEAYNSAKVSIDTLHNEWRARLEISENVEDELDERIFALQGMLEFLRDCAKDLVYEENHDDPETEFCQSVLTRESIGDGIGMNIPESFETDIEEARNYVRERGLKKYIVYLNTTLGNVSTLHSRLDGITGSCETPSANRFWAKNNFERFAASDTHCTSLVDGHYWSKSSGDLILIRTGERGGYDFDAVASELTNGGSHDVEVETPEGVRRRHAGASN